MLRAFFWLFMLALVVIVPAMVVGAVSGPKSSSAEAGILAVVWILAIGYMLERIAQATDLDFRKDSRPSGDPPMT